MPTGSQDSGIVDRTCCGKMGMESPTVKCPESPFHTPSKVGKNEMAVEMRISTPRDAVSESHPCQLGNTA